MVNKNRKAVIWSGVEKVGTYLVNFVIQIVLARLLCPDDYAVVAMLAIFFSLSQAFIDSGFTTALIQKQDCNQQDYCSVFFFNLAVALIFYILFFVTAPLIERFYGFPQLGLVTRVYSLNIVIHSFVLVHRAILIKQLRFKAIAVVSFTSYILSAIPAIIMAFYGAAFWTLVVQVLISATITTILMSHLSKWRPSFLISKQSLKNLAPFGMRVLVVQIFHAIYNNIYSLLIGKKFTAAELGCYDRGKTLSSTGIVGFNDFYTRALYPIQSKMQNDSSALEESYNRSFRLICVIILPLAAYMTFFSSEVVFTLLGDKWHDSAIILSILCLGYMMYPLQGLNMNMLKVKAKGDFLLRSELIKKSIGIVCVLVLINYNLTIVAWGWVACSLMEFVISEYYYRKLYRCPLKTSLLTLMRSVVLAFILSCFFHYLLCHFITNMYVVCILGAVLYFSTFYLINIKTIIPLIKTSV